MFALFIRLFFGVVTNFILGRIGATIVASKPYSGSIW